MTKKNDQGRSPRSKFRLGRTTTWIGVVLTAGWALHAAGTDLLWIAAATTLLIALGRRLRHNKPLLLTVAAAIITTALLTSATLWMMSNPTAASQQVAGVLTGFVLAGPVPAAVAWMWPPDLGHRHRLAAAGSVTLLLGASIPLVTGTPAGAGANVLVCLVLIVAGHLLYHRHHRARFNRTTTETPFGWTDLGIRTLSTGTSARLLHCRGALMVCLPIRGQNPTRRSMTRAVATAAAAAKDLHLNPRWVQPVLLTEEQDRGELQRTSCTVGEHTTTVVIAHPDMLAKVASNAPTRKLRLRRPPTRSLALTGSTS